MKARTKMRGSMTLVLVLGAGAASFAAGCSDAAGDAAPPTAPVADAAGDPAAPDGAVAVPSEAAADGAAPASGEHTVSIGVGYATGCALSNLGHVKCWGDAADGELLTPPAQGKQCYLYGDDSFIDCDPRGVTELAIPDPVVELSVGYLNVCVIANHGGTKRLGCWGKDSRGSLTSAAPADGVVSSILWIPLPAEPRHVVQSRHFKLVELEDGTVWAWGDNRYGQYGGAQLGESSTPERVFPPAGAAPGTAPKILAIGASYLDSFVLTDDGLFGVGDNTSSQLMIDADDAEEVHAFTKLAVPDGDVVAQLFTSGGYAVGQCYVTAAGRARCWGDNDHGQVGSDETSLVASVISPELVDLPSDRKVRGMAIGSGQTCAVLDDGAVYCWGENDRGESGHAVLGDVYVPVRVGGLDKAVAVAAGRAAVTCALTAEAKTYCWGDNSFGQLGTPPASGGTGARSVTPVEVPLRW